MSDTNETTAEQEASIALLRKLTSDDALRERIVTDTKAVLIEHGIACEDHDVPGVITLPSKEELGAQLSDIEAQIRGMAVGMFFLVLR